MHNSDLEKIIEKQAELVCKFEETKKIISEKIKQVQGNLQDKQKDGITK